MFAIALRKFSTSSALLCFSLLLIGFEFSPQTEAVSFIFGEKCNYSTDAEMCTFCRNEFLTCDAQQRVTSLNYSKYRLKYLPTHFGMLSALTSLSLSDSGIQGTIPTEIGVLVIVSNVAFGKDEIVVCF